MERIGRETRLSTRTVRRAIAHLTDLGYLSSRPRYLKHQQRSSLRQLLIPETLPEGHPYDREGLTHAVRRGVTNVSGLGVTPVVIQKPSKELLHINPPLEVVAVVEKEREQPQEQERSEEETDLTPPWTKEGKTWEEWAAEAGA